MTRPPGAFTTATSVTRGDIPEHEEAAVYHAELVAGWDILGNANGGYLMALAARALTDHTGRPQPASLTAHFLTPGTPGPLRIEVATLRSGRRFATARALMRTDEGRPVLAVLGTFGDPGAAESPSETGPGLVDASPPELPPVDDCIPSAPPGTTPEAAPGFMNKVDLRLHPDDAGFREGQPSGRARIRGWFRFPDEEPVDEVGLLCALDAFPPTVFNAELPVNWVPTLEFTGHIRCRPAPGWLACEFTTRIVTAGFLEEDGLIWDSRGAPVAQSRQLALVPRS